MKKGNRVNVLWFLTDPIYMLGDEAEWLCWAADPPGLDRLRRKYKASSSFLLRCPPPQVVTVANQSMYQIKQLDFSLRIL